MRDRLAELLLHIQTSVAFAMLLFATQEGRHAWVSVITVSGLITWILLSFFLLIHFNDYLLTRSPWSVFAVLGPVVVWASVASAKEVDFYYAGLLSPVWIAIGLNALVIHDRQNNHNFRRVRLKDGCDPESGYQPPIEPNATFSRPGRLRTQDIQAHRRDI